MRITDSSLLLLLSLNAVLIKEESFPATKLLPIAPVKFVASGLLYFISPHGKLKIFGGANQAPRERGFCARCSCSCSLTLPSLQIATMYCSLSCWPVVAYTQISTCIYSSATRWLDLYPVSDEHCHLYRTVFSLMLVIEEQYNLSEE